jgi:Interferon-induced 6-16 family
MHLQYFMRAQCSNASIHRISHAARGFRFNFRYQAQSLAFSSLSKQFTADTAAASMTPGCAWQWATKRDNVLLCTGVAAGAVLLPLAAAAALGAAGFGAGGIVANTAASAYMAATGPVATGSMFAAAQSAGAAGFGAASTAAMNGVGAAAGAAAAWLLRKKNDAEAPEQQDADADADAADAPLVDELPADQNVPVDDAGDPDVPPIGAVYV